MKTKDAPYFITQTVQRALQIANLLTVAEDGLGLVQVADAMNLPKAMAFRLLATMEHHGFVERDSQTRRYHAGLKAFEFGSSHLRDSPLLNAAKPIMEGLMGGPNHCVHLSVMHRRHVLWLLSLINKLHIDKPEIGRSSIYYTASGKVFLSELPEPHLTEILAHMPVAGPTPRSFTDASKFRSHIATVRSQGFGLNDEETVVGYRALAAPVRGQTGRIVAALSISASCTELSDALLTERIPQLQGAAAALSRRLGFDPVGTTAVLSSEVLT